jgi:hypothetical protein
VIAANNRRDTGPIGLDDFTSSNVCPPAHPNGLGALLSVIEPPD